MASCLPAVPQDLETPHSRKNTGRTHTGCKWARKDTGGLRGTRENIGGDWTSRGTQRKHGRTREVNYNHTMSHVGGTSHWEDV